MTYDTAMTRTTKWRRRLSESNINRLSPSRPSISPPPFSPSPDNDHHSLQSEYQHGNQFIYGLGLTGADVITEEIDHPNRLYIDQNGGAHVVGPRSRSRTKVNAKGGSQVKAQAQSRNTKRNKRKNHTRSGSTIDDLADAAIATSPRFIATSPTQALNGSPIAFNYARPATSHNNGHNFGDSLLDRPAKRIKSESMLNDGRPRTSHVTEYQSPRPEEAELLLGLRYAWGVQASPSQPLATLHSSTHQDRIIPPVESTSALDNDAPNGIADENNLNRSEAVIVPGVMRTNAEEELNDEGRNTNIDNQETKTTMKLDGETTNVEAKTAEELLSLDGVKLSDSANVKQGTTQETATPPVQPAKKPRKIQPEIQAEVCASCLKLQRDGNDEDHTTQWIGCEHCKKWFHNACVGFKDKQEARSVDKFYCQDCEGTHGTTTFVRKSSRARTAIDYAGLNEGVIKPSDESTMHHYVQAFRDGRIQYLPDDFARVRPELMTAQFWESMDSMKRPFVVPACWNPRFGEAQRDEDALIDSINTEPSLGEHDIPFDEAGEASSRVPQPSSKIGDGTLLFDSGSEVIDTDQDYLDMVMPRNLTVRTVAELYGPEQPVPVIDVKSQETKGQFTLAEWATYYEQQGDKPIRNVISLEVSNSRLGRLIRRPRVVRDIDLEDSVWDFEGRGASNKRPVQFYCLMSVADSYTDFHIDFGGSSVYYHILKGVKTFFFIPPEDRYLKKYEEWCNSDTQNETWLGDLCGGNVTRVDLHEGDTAFIPAGWIHSVWTPKDSLVIGGNFLTRLDYELQLKVANIEKTTRVPQKFRYPFFQKVMWYSLLKYLEDDPVPDEVLRDFHEDDDYRYLRANPIYSDPDNLITIAEPGSADFNARIYSKSELRGLSSLRDYLYRTARIHADLAVPDINKRQIDAVKASIPKGHGDPLQLIKTFAVWCAWKIGNEKVPEWVHTDMEGLLPELKEREKSRRVETTHQAPERISARKAKESRKSPLPPEPTSPEQKPIKSPDSEDSAKKSNDAKFFSSRIACDACRKRRIKCRHKEAETETSGSSPAEIRPRTYSNVSVEIQKLVPAPASVNEHETVAVSNGNGQGINNSDLAQAALATLQSQSTETTTPLQMFNPLNSIKKGRSKACEECRKSKRRCVHDEYGRVDPAKAAEPAKPRGSTNTKRAARTSDEPPLRKLKLDSEHDPVASTPVRSEITDAMIDPALMGDGFGTPLSELHYDHAFNPAMAINLHHDDLLPENEGINMTMTQGNGIAQDQLMADAVHWQPNYANEMDFVNLSTPGKGGRSHKSPARHTSYSPITVDGENPSGQGFTNTGHLAGQPMASKGPLPTHPLAETHSLEGIISAQDRSISTAPTGRRASSEKSGQTGDTPLKSRRSSSNTSNTTHLTAVPLAEAATSHEMGDRPASRGSAAISEADADEKLARELQAAENGLRRRASLRA